MSIEIHELNMAMGEESERQNIQIDNGQATYKKQNSDPQPVAINPGNQSTVYSNQSREPN